MDTVVHFGEFAFGCPPNEFLLLFLKALEFTDKINLKFRADPHSKLESDVLVSICAAITPGFGNYANSMGLLRPFFSAEAEIVEARFTFNYVEFGRIKLGIENLLPSPINLYHKPNPTLRFDEGIRMRHNHGIDLLIRHR
jgi:hypothetical protein